MPSIELICVGQVQPPELPALPFAICFEKELRSHRSPTPLFEQDFESLTGWIYHLGNPRCAEPGYGGPFFAYELLSGRSQDSLQGLFELAPDVLPSVKTLVDLLLGWSTERRVLFTTDWQGGPMPPLRAAPMGRDAFWQMHGDRQLRINALYPIVEPVTPPPAAARAGTLARAGGRSRS